MGLFEILSQFALLSLLIDEIDERAGLIAFLDIIVGLLHYVTVQLVIGVDGHSGTPP